MSDTQRHPVVDNVKTLFPGYFAMVMATGIVATGAAQEDLHVWADGLYAVAAITFVVLCLLLFWRLVRFPR